MDSVFQVNRIGWRIRLAQYSKFLLRWGWFVVLSVMTITVCSFFIPDSLSSPIVQATLQIQVPLPSGLGGLPTTNNTTAYFSSVLLSPASLSLALPEINNNLGKAQLSSPIQLTDLASLVTATPIPDTPQILLSAVGSNDQGASFLVTTVYNAFLHYLHDERNTVFNELHNALTNELSQAQADFANSTSSLQSLSASGRATSFQFRELTNLNREQRNYINSINSLLLSLNSYIVGTSNTFNLSSSTPAFTTLDTAAPTQGVRLILSPFIGVIMGISGALIANHYSNRLPLRRKKRETVLAHLMGIIPQLALARSKKRSRAAALQRASSACQPLLLKLPYHFSEQGKSLRVINVTSPSRREGKSTIAAMLAAAAASKGLRTLLVDANLQRPVLHSWFAVSNVTGLPEVIRAFANEVLGPSPVQSTSITNLSIIPAGTIKQPGGSRAKTGVLQVRELQSWIGRIRQQADLIIFDSSALLTDPNAIHLAALSDVTLLVVDAQRSRATKASEAEKIFKDIGIDFATVLNRADRDSVE